MSFASWHGQWCCVRDRRSKPNERQATYRYGPTFEELETRLAPAAISPIASFINTSGDHPYGPPIQDAAGNLFGTTADGGTSGGFGTVFEVKAGSGTINTLATFNNTNGADPEGGLVEDSSGNLFGTTVHGGPGGFGTVFEVKAGSGAITTLASFNNVNGARPYAGVIEDAGGNRHHLLWRH